MAADSQPRVLEMLADPYSKESVPARRSAPGKVRSNTCWRCATRAKRPSSCTGRTTSRSATSSCPTTTPPSLPEPTATPETSPSRRGCFPEDMSWRELITGVWTQFVISKAGAEFRDLGTNPAPPDVHLRGFIDRQTKAYLARQAAPGYARSGNPGSPNTAAEARSRHPAVRRPRAPMAAANRLGTRFGRRASPAFPFPVMRGCHEEMGTLGFPRRRRPGDAPGHGRCVLPATQVRSVPAGPVPAGCRPPGLLAHPRSSPSNGNNQGQDVPLAQHRRSRTV